MQKTAKIETVIIPSSSTMLIRTETAITNDPEEMSPLSGVELLVTAEEEMTVAIVIVQKSCNKKT